MLDKQDNAALNPGTSDLSRHPALAFLDGRTATGDLAPLSSVPATFAVIPPSLMTETPYSKSPQSAPKRDTLPAYLPGSSLDYAFKALLAGSVAAIGLCVCLLIFGEQLLRDSEMRLPKIGLALAAIAALLYGIVVPRKVTRNGMMAVILGVLLLIALAGLIFLPAQTPLFLMCVVVFLAMLIPATILLGTEIS